MEQGGPLARDSAGRRSICTLDDAEYSPRAATPVRVDLGEAYVPLHNRATANRRRKRMLSWRPLVKESLRRFANAHPLIRLVIHDVPVLISGGNVWATLPSKPQTDPEARLKRDPSSKAYSAILKWRDRTLADRFSAAVIELIVEKHGAGALDGGGSR